MEILFLTTVLPQRLSTGGEIASQAVIETIAARDEHEVTVVGYQRRGDRAPADAVVAGRRAIETDRARRAEQAAWMATALIHALPYSAGKYRSRRYRRAVRSLARSRSFDAAVVDHAQSGWIQPDLERLGIPFVALLHNVEHRLYSERASHARGVARAVHAREARLVRALEEKLASGARAVWVLADDDARYFAAFAKTKTLRLPSMLPPPPPSPRTESDVALLGTWTWRPTREGLEWFVGDVLPLLPPGLAVDVAGRGGEWLRGAAPGVRYRGFVPDAMEFLSSARAVAVPSLRGTGVQVKTLDAIASGRPVVCTSSGVRGLDDLPPSLRVAGSAEEFASLLAEAVRQQPTAGERDAALEWARSRRERFDRDVTDAIEAAAGRP